MPLPEGMTKLQELPVGLDWQLVKAGQTPGPGQYYKDDTLDSIPGGKMAKGKAKTAVEWEQYRSSQIPAPGQYYVDDTLDSIPGGSLAKSKAKTAVDWECYRAAQQPGPDYDLDKSWAYIDGRNGRAGFTMKSRSGPAALPAPYAQFAAPGNQEIRGDPHPSHQQALTPWREADWKQRKHEAAQALNRRRGRQGSSRGGEASEDGSEAPLKDDYTSSLTPWRDQSLGQSGSTQGGAAASAVKASGPKRRQQGNPTRSRPGSAPPSARPRSAARSDAGDARAAALDGLEQMEQSAAEEKLDPEQQRIAAEIAAMPWRDKESWVRSNAQVIRMRKDMDEKAQALKSKMEQVRRDARRRTGDARTHTPTAALVTHKTHLLLGYDCCPDECVSLQAAAAFRRFGLKTEAGG